MKLQCGFKFKLIRAEYSGRTELISASEFGEFKFEESKIDRSGSFKYATASLCWNSTSFKLKEKTIGDGAEET